MLLAARFAALAALSFALLPAAARAGQGGAAAEGPAAFAPRLGWGAELEFELSAAGSDAGEPAPHFQNDQLYLYPELERTPTFAEGLLLKTEYYANGEKTGGMDVDNDEILLQLELKWP